MLHAPAIWQLLLFGGLGAWLREVVRLARYFDVMFSFFTIIISFNLLLAIDLIINHYLMICVDVKEEMRLLHVQLVQQNFA